MLTDLVTSNLSEMSKALAKTRDPELVEDFLRSLLTSSEVDEISKRWALVKDLARGTPQRVIAANLGLSLCKITRGSRELQRENSPFRRLLVTAGYDVPERIVMKRGPRAKAAACDD
ncbi:MAG: Trp family transcriptional regulator [Treponema sp.]|nr:Trp family transcriptional regulator [Treponema sp.]